MTFFQRPFVKARSAMTFNPGWAFAEDRETRRSSLSNETTSELDDAQSSSSCAGRYRFRRNSAESITGRSPTSR